MSIKDFQIDIDARTPRKNVIINGNFDIWQRGTSLPSGTGNRYLSDRWLNLSVGSTYIPIQQFFTLGQTAVPNNPKYFHRQVVSSVAGAGNFSLLQERIEDVSTFGGEEVTLSFWAKADTAKNIATEFVQNFGTGGAPSTQVDIIGVTTHALTTSWQKFTVTANIPSVSGKSLGTNDDDFLSIHFWFDAGSSFNSRTNTLGQQSGTFDIAQVQIEKGPLPTQFELLNIQDIIAMCERYFQKGRMTGIWYGVSGFGGASIERNIRPMRAIPTISTTVVSETAIFIAISVEINSSGTSMSLVSRWFNQAITGENSSTRDYELDAEL